jgi:hypothetical protein
VATLPPDETGTLPRRGVVQGIPSHDSDATCPLTESCGVTLSDFTVAIVTAVEEEDSSLSWGIVQDEHQLLLSYPSIGCGSVEYENQEHFVCCLRGGTTYLIPSGKEELGYDSSVTVFFYPHDVDSDSTSRFVQGFTAGNLLVRQGDQTLERMPVLVFCWAGGIIDVYVCGLFQQQFAHGKRSFTKE